MKLWHRYNPPGNKIKSHMWSPIVTKYTTIKLRVIQLILL